MDYTDVYKNCQIEINREATPSLKGTFSIIVTGWTNPKECSWEKFPNSLVRGFLYNKDSGVDRLITNLSRNTSIDRVYLVKLTEYDNISGSIDQAYQRLIAMQFPVSLVTDLSTIKKLPVGARPIIEPLYPVEKTLHKNPTFSGGIVIRGSNIKMVKDKSQQYILKYGKYCPDRGFTALPVITHVIEQTIPIPYEPYFKLWDGPKSDPSVEYTYGDYLSKHTELLKTINNSTQATIHLELPGSKHPPCLSLVQRWQNNLIATFRSHDIGQAFEPNTKALIYLMQKLELTGTLTVISNVPHIYDWDKPDHVPVFVPDPVGNITGYKLEGRYYLELNNQPWIEASSKRGLKRKLAEKLPVMDTEHSFYLSDLINTL